ncbi:MAG: hypothetical protein NZ703_00005 [Gemmataceae bacterium]|nr:hypothetical protein [Gemmataceae bacterium]MCS7269443.1 hypothetical protein [Gemmataceae bacterium]MDW8242327.1 hypothetical protein [Thermogemmata sp.]
MSRVYSAQTGTGPSAIAPTGTGMPDDGVWENSPEEVPYIEIGGPEGPIGTVINAVPATETTARTTRAEGSNRSPSSSTAARPYPRLAEPATLSYLSVRFHGFPSLRTASSARSAEPDASLVVFHQPQHPISNEYRSVWQAIVQQCGTEEPHVLYVVAARAEAGLSTVLLNLAVQAARQQAGRILLVDTHLERPALASRLGQANTPGLREVLREQCPLALALQPSCVEQVHLLAAGEAEYTSPEHLGRTLPLLLEQLRQWYDWVLVDAGVWGELPQRDAVCAVADALYVVARETDVTGDKVTELRSQARRLGGLPRGAIATRLA